MTTYNTFAPLFPGFYNTVFEYYSEDSDIKSYNDENGTDYEYDNFTWDYAEYHNRVAKAFVNRLETELKVFLPVKLDFQKVVSPKEYNFETDSIYISAKLDLKQLLKLTRDRWNDAEKYFKERYTSCDGFISSHSNDIADWLNKDYILEKPEHRIGALLDCLCEIEIDKDRMEYWTDSESYISFTLIEQ